MKKNIIIFGSRKISIDAIEYIKNNYSADCEIALVVTCDNESDRIYHDELVVEYCNRTNLPNINSIGPVECETIKKIQPSLILSFYYRKILSKEIIDIPSHGAINLHPAQLPKYRGPSPSLWSILNGDKFAGVTMHYITEGVDAGDIIAQEKYAIKDMTGFELNAHLMELCCTVFKNNFAQILNGTNTRIKQNELDATYCLPFNQALRYVVWSDPDYILNQVRAFAKPFDGALTRISDGTVVVISAAKKLSSRNSQKPPGFFEQTAAGIIVQTGTLPILITEYEVVEGKLASSGRFISFPAVGR